MTPRRGERERLAALGARGDEIRGAGRVGPFSVFVLDAAFTAPRSAPVCPPPFPGLHPCPGASPTFSRHDEVMLRMVGRSHASHGRRQH